MFRPGPRGAAYAVACLFAVALAADLLWMPVQVSDSVGEILDARGTASIREAFLDSFGSEGYLRPLRIAQIKALFDAADGRYYSLVYRGFHALLIVAAVLLFVRALRVRTAVDFAAASFALAVLVGLHTFRGTVQEAFPINHFLQIAVFCLVVLNLAKSKGGLWVDFAAALAFAAAALTLESGLLVWVVAAAAWAAGWRGISTRGLVVMTLLLAGYGYLRFAYLDTGVPSISERSSGYFLEVLERDEIEQRFGADPLPFHAYNVAASFASVLFAEPRSGVFEAVNAWRNETPLPRALLPVATSVATTLLIVVVGLQLARRRWWPLDDALRPIAVFWIVLAANAAMSFAYTKDEIMSVAGMFYALAAFAAMRHVLQSSAGLHAAAAGIVGLALCVLATGWAVRALGVHYVLRSQAVKHQIDWVELPGRWQRDDRWPREPADERLLLLLYSDAVRLRLPNTRSGGPEWPNRIWIE